MPSIVVEASVVGGSLAVKIGRLKNQPFIVREEERSRKPREGGGRRAFFPSGTASLSEPETGKREERERERAFVLLCFRRGNDDPSCGSDTRTHKHSHYTRTLTLTRSKGERKCSRTQHEKQFLSIQKEGQERRLERHLSNCAFGPSVRKICSRQKQLLRRRRSKRLGLNPEAGASSMSRGSRRTALPVIKGWRETLEQESRGVDALNVPV